MRHISRVLDLIISHLLRTKHTEARYRIFEMNKTTKLRMYYGSLDTNIALSTKVIIDLKLRYKNILTFWNEIRKESPYVTLKLKALSDRVNNIYILTHECV